MVDIEGLFERIQTDALDSSVPLADTLRRCIAIGGGLSAPGLVDWARAELDGYRADADLPGYRRLKATLRMDYVKGYNSVTGQQVTSDLVDEEMRASMYDVPLRQTLSELEFIASDPKAAEGLRISPTDGGLLRSMVYRNVEHKRSLAVMAVYWDVTQAEMRAVVDAVRTRLVTMVAEFDIEIAKPGVTPQTAALTAISVVARTGATVTVNSSPNGIIASATTVAAPAERKPRFWETAWWTVGRAIYGAVMLVLAAAATFFAWFALN